MLLVAICSAIACAAPRISWSVLGTLPNGHVLTQIHHQLPEGWHTYWKNPGDSGQGARISPMTPGVTFGPLEFPKLSVIPAGLGHLWLHKPSDLSPANANTPHGRHHSCIV